MMFGLFFGLIATVVFIYSWVGYSKYQFIERDSADATVKLGANKTWHKYKFTNQVAFFAVLGFLIGLGNAFICALVYQLGFNTFFNLRVTNQPYYHLGSVNTIDVFLKSKLGEKTAYLIQVAAILGLIVIRFVFPHIFNFKF